MLQIVVASTFICEPLGDVLHYWLNQLGWTFSIEFAPYNQVIQHLVDSKSMLNSNKNGINIIALDFEDWHTHADFSKLKENLTLFLKALEHSRTDSFSHYFISISPFSNKLKPDALIEMTQLHDWFISLLKNKSNIKVINNNELQTYYPVDPVQNDFTYNMAHVPYIQEYYIAVGTLLARKMFSLKLKPFKVIILDCDNTLWSGACAELRVSEILISRKFIELQEFMLRQRENGKLLCLCSKNREEDVWSVFSEHPDMLLTKKDISAFRINWKCKSDNIRSLAEELCLGTDSFIFIDDNPVECAEVRRANPEVLSIYLPDNIIESKKFLKDIWFFDQIESTKEDKTRASSYQQNADREHFKKSTINKADFIAGLELYIEISPLSQADLSRASQLTSRTNQFNFTTIRRTESELVVLKNQGYLCWAIRVKDRFGNYGLTGLLIYKEEKNRIIVDTFLLSCRILGRGVEHKVLSQLGSKALKNNIDQIIFNFTPTSRNEPAYNFLQSIAQKHADTNSFILNSVEASKVKINLEINYSRHPSTRHPERSAGSPFNKGLCSIKESLHYVQDDGRVERGHALVNLTTKLSDVNKIKQAIDSHFFTSRTFLNLGTAYVAPRTDLEITMAQIWEKTLRINPIGICDNYFELGGTSLLAVQILSEIQRIYKVNMSMTELFHYPVIAQLMHRVENLREQEVTGLADAKAESMWPISFAQERFYYLYQLAEKSIFNVPVILHLKGNLQPTVLQNAFQILVNQNDILRSRIRMNNGTLVNEILCIKDAAFLINYQDISPCKQSISDFVNTEINKEFLLSEFPLMRATLFKTQHQEFVFCFVIHHIISDAYSLDTLFNRLAEQYNAFILNQPIIQRQHQQEYKEFVTGQRRQFTDGKWEYQLAYWIKQLKGASYPSLKNDLRRPQRSSYRGDHITTNIDKLTYKKLSQIARKEKVTLFMLSFAIFNLTLFRQSRNKELVVGIPVANRHNPGIAETLGLFVNTLAIRIKANETLSFHEFLQEVKSIMLAAFEHQDIPFDHIVSSLQIKPTLNQHPLFPVMFSFGTKRKLLSPLANLEVEFIHYHSPWSFFDLTVLIEDSGNDLMICFEYGCDIFDKKTIHNYLQCFTSLLEEISNNPQIKLVDILKFNPLDDIEQSASMNINDVTLHQCFEEQVRLHPNHPALVFNNHTLTYQELNNSANLLAQRLRSKYDIQPGKLVAIAMDSCMEYMISILAILKAGAAYLPLDPEYPANRLQWMMNDAIPALLITSTNYLSTFKPLHDNILELEQTIWQKNNNTKYYSNPVNLNHNSDLAYVIYTSGSSGQPKGVMIEHRAVINVIQVLKNNFYLNPPGRILQLSSMSFDMSVWEWLMALQTGSTLYLTEHQTKRDPKKLIAFCNQYHITHLSLTPSMLALITEPVPTLKVLVMGGEAVPPYLVQEWYKKVPVLINAYGPTETTIIASFHRFFDESSLVIGTPISNLKFYILDANQKPVSAGKKGELYIGGTGLARGYLNLPELTNEKFISTHLGRLYKTGDLVRLQENGKFEFLGRNDYQVKARGYRIELNEIEQRLACHPAIIKAVVILNDNSQLVACLVVHKKSAIQYDNLNLIEYVRTYSTDFLPEYMMPSYYVVLESADLPVLPNSKTDRKALEKLGPALASKQKIDLPLSDLVQIYLQAVWKDVLKLQTVRVDLDFFLAGGNSLLAVKLLSKIEEKLNYSISINEFYSAPDIEKMSILIKKKIRMHFDIGNDNDLFEKSLFPIQTKGSKAPLFIVHPSFGLALPYLNLGSCFPDQPVYGLSNPYFANNAKQFGSISEMAQFYIRVIEKVLNSNSFILSGWSFGGIVALEMNRQLQQKNRHANHIILIDSYNPGLIMDKPDHLILELLLKNGIDPQSAEAAFIEFQIESNNNLLNTFSTERPYQGNFSLIKAQQSSPQFHYNGWENTLHPLPNLYQVNAKHEELFDPCYLEGAIADTIRKILNSAPELSPPF